jgi:hypothetical protein
LVPLRQAAAAPKMTPSKEERIKADPVKSSVQGSLSLIMRQWAFFSGKNNRSCPWYIFLNRCILLPQGLVEAVVFQEWKLFLLRQKGHIFSGQKNKGIPRHKPGKEEVDGQL